MHPWAIKCFRACAKFLVGLFGFFAGLLATMEISPYVQCGGCFIDFDIQGLMAGVVIGFFTSVVLMKLVFK